MKKRSKIFVAFASFICLALALLIGKLDYLGILASIVVIVVIPVIVLFWIYPNFGLITTLIVSYFILGILRFIDIPLGTMLDGMVFLLFLKFLWDGLNKNNHINYNNPLIITVIVWIIYNLLEVANPSAASREAWVYTIRSIALTQLLFFVSIKLFTNESNYKLFFKIWIFLSLLLASYGIYQELHGLLPFEEAWIREKESRFLLFYNWGRFRKCSFFPDPSNYGIVCAYSAVFCLIYAFGHEIKIYKRILAIGISFVMLYGMVFSGARTAYVMPVAGFIFYVCLNFNWKVMIFALVFLVGFGGVILSPIKSLGPLDANNLERIRSAFMPTDDPSFQVRLKNQRFIQPYIQTHPLGGGLGSTGEWGKRFSPWSPLSQFPPDSGFVKIGVEQGLIGLIIYCIMLYFIFNSGVNLYFKTEDENLKNYLSPILCTIFSIVVANYAQETITMYPTSIIFYSFMGFIIGNYLSLNKTKTS